MKKKYILKADESFETGLSIVNFDSYYCNTSEELLNSELFKNIFSHYINFLKTSSSDLIPFYEEIKSPNIYQNILELYKLLLVIDIDVIKTYKLEYKEILDSPKQLNYLTEGLYNYWRHLSRFAIVSKNSSQGIIDISNHFNDLVISTYRLITEKLITEHYNVYRQLPAGVNACLETFNADVHTKNISKDIDIIKTVFIRPPYLATTKANKRIGIFKVIDEDITSKLIIKKDHWLMLPLYIGEYLAYFYFHHSFIHHAVGLCNLYKVASQKECMQKPNIICYMGIDQNIIEENSIYYDYDKHQYIGYITNKEENDYFGYAKKMLLTLHNSLVIKDGKLPIHGAMARITFKKGIVKNVILVGDSGAGKSELVEAIRANCKNDIIRIRIVYDDMGLIGISNSELYTSGTEIGAFVRLDDLDQGYAYEEIDRSIFMNPSQSNARVIIPITPYEEVIRKYKIDLLLYANNYIDNKENLVIYEDADEAKKIFIEGKRIAKGTTQETGISSSFFANPFGPVQYEEETNKLIDKYFSLLKQNNINVGVIYTKLAINNMQKVGPKEASLSLINYLLKK